MHGISRWPARRWSAAVAAWLAMASSAALAEWTQFRGPRGDGHVVAPGGKNPIGLPLKWSETENVKWKTPIPHRGWSTPVVMGDQIWLTTATNQGHDFFVIRVDAKRGKIALEKRLFHCDDPEPLGNNVNCYGSPSPAIEAGRVYISFGSYGTACLDTATDQVVWERDDLPCRHYRGPGSSVILFENLLILTMDGVDVQYMAALDKKTGKTVWKTDRTTVWNDLDASGNPKREGDFRKAFSTPIVADAGGMPQLLTVASTSAFAYEARTGKELWKVHFPGYSSAPAPLFDNGLAYITTGRAQTAIWAVRVDGKGDVTDSHVAWKVQSRDVPFTPSPILVDGLLYMVSDGGMVTCLESATGKEVWKERIGGNYYASPIYGDGRLYFSSSQGKTTVIEAGREYKLLTSNRLEGSFMASPAVAGSDLILRTKAHLYRIGNP